MLALGFSIRRHRAIVAPTFETFTKPKTMALTLRPFVTIRRLMPNPAPTILTYASPDANGGLPYLRPMNRWRLGCLVSFLFTLWVPFFTPWPLLAILGLPALL